MYFFIFFRSVKKERKIDLRSDSEEDMDNPAARILDQLYGDTWRGLNALPVTEPRNLKPKKVHVTKPPLTERYVIKQMYLFIHSFIHVCGCVYANTLESTNPKKKLFSLLKNLKM